MALDYASKESSQRKPGGYLLAALLITMLALWGIAQTIHDYSKSSTVCTEIDINSGRTRQVRHLFGFDRDEKLQQTVISTAMPLGKQLPAQWIQVSPGDCFAGHSAYCEVQALADLYRATPFTPNAKRVIAANMVRIWRTRREVTSLDRYIEELEKAADVVSKDSPRPVDVADLPKDPRPPLKVFGQR